MAGRLNVARGSTRTRRNPTLAILGNPPHRGECMSVRVYEVRYRHITDNKDYKHEFKGGVRMYALPDGTIQLVGVHDQRLWEDFD